MTKIELIHALFDSENSDEIYIGVGHPLSLVPLGHVCRLEVKEDGKRRTVLAGEFAPTLTTFTCRTCRGAHTAGTLNPCPACDGTGRVNLNDYKRW